MADPFAPSFTDYSKPKPPDERTCVAGGRIYRFQKERLDKEYDGNISLVYRYLLTKFFEKDSTLKQEFDTKLKEKQTT